MKVCPRALGVVAVSLIGPMAVLGNRGGEGFESYTGDLNVQDFFSMGLERFGFYSLCEGRYRLV